MEKIKEEINFSKLKDELKYISCLIFSNKNSCKRFIENNEEDYAQLDEVSEYKIIPKPIFNLSEIPNEVKDLNWMHFKNKKYLQIPTFAGKFKELIYEKDIPQMILEDAEGKEFNIILNMEENFDELQSWMLDLKYEVGKYVIVYDAYKINFDEKKYCMVVESMDRMTNENWVCRIKPRSGVSAKYVPKIVVALIMLVICWYYDLR